MPSIQDLEKFRSSFRSIGGEAETLADQGKSYEDLPLPEESGIDAGMAALLGTDGEEPPLDLEEPAETGTVETQDTGGDFDFGAFLDSIPDKFGTEVPESALEAPDETGVPEPAAPEEEPADEFGLPEGLLDGLADDLESAAAEGEEPAQPEPPLEDIEEAPAAESAEPGDGFGDFDFSMPAGFDLGEGLQESEPGQSGQEASEQGPEEFAAETPEEAQPFDFGQEEISNPEETPSQTESPSLEETEAFDLFTEEPSESPAPEEKPTKEESGLEDFGIPDTGGTEDSDFSIPDFSFDDETAPEGGNLGEESVEELGAEAGTSFEEGTFEEGNFDEVDLGGENAEDGAGSGPAADQGTEDFGFPDDFGSSFSEEDAVNAPLDSFDTFSLDNSFSSSDFGGAGEKTEGEVRSDEFATLEDFSLEGIDDVFKSPSQSAPQQKQETRGRPAAGRGGKRPAAGEVEEINLTDEDLAALQETLAGYPLNLRIACEELIAEHAVPPDQMSALVHGLVKGTPAREMADLAGRLIGKSIAIPKGFEKSSGAALEAERNTFAYAFVHNILPVLRIFVFAALVTASAVYLSFEFVYKPIRAEYLYSLGEKNVKAGEYARGNDRFEEAGNIWRKKKWYYRYAEAFIDKNQYLLAEEKYDQLLSRYAHDKKGAMDYANLETYVLLNYEKADGILRHQILDFDVKDKDALLALGDNNLAWGEFSPDRYEEARKNYTQLMMENGRQDEYLERMLLYFIRTDNLAEALPLQEHFLSQKKPKISTAALAEFGGYLLDKKVAEPKGVPDPNIAKIEDIKKVLLIAAKRDALYPETFYHLTRYYEHYGQTKEELSAAQQALKDFEAFSNLPVRAAMERYAIRPNRSLRWTKYRIDTDRRLAALYVQGKEFIKAEEVLDQGIALYEDALAKRIMPRTASFGRLYADLGDIEYFKAGDLPSAEKNYQDAILNGWDRPEIRYRLGYAAYADGRWQDALTEFFQASADLPLNRRMLFALGNTLYRRGDLHAAQGYYSRLLDLLQTERGRFTTLAPSEYPEHADLADRIMSARNNLGVTLMDLAERSGDARIKSRALALYAESAQVWDAITRDPKSMIRSGSTNLAYLNTRGSLYPTSLYEPQIYSEIDKDVLEPSMWEDLLED